MTFFELRAAIVTAINKANDLSAEEIYGVVSSVEAEVRFVLLGSMKTTKEKESAEGGEA